MNENKLSEEFVPGSGLRKLARITSYKDPLRFSSMDEHLRPLFAEIKAHKASDVYINEGKPISVSVQGRMYAITWRCIDKGEAQFFLGLIAGQSALSNLSQQIAVNTKFGLFDEDKNKKTLAGHRVQDSFRVNASGTMTQGLLTFEMVLRTIPSDPFRYYEIGLDELFVLHCCPSTGIVYFSGVTGSGKSTTMSSIIRYVLENDTPIKGNILTHEEPIEFTYDNIMSEHSIVAQSQIPECFKDFRAANREAMRRKPAAIIMGEIRDKESVLSAIDGANTGHPVYATVHAGSVIKIFSRLISQYDESEQKKALYDIISSTAIMVSQRLVPKTNGKQMAVQEYVVFTKEIREELLLHNSEQGVNSVLKREIENGKNDKSHHASKSFAEQGRELYEQNIIGVEGLRMLTAGE